MEVDLYSNNLVYHTPCLGNIHVFTKGSEKKTKHDPNWFVKSIFDFLTDHLVKNSRKK